MREISYSEDFNRLHAPYFAEIAESCDDIITQLEQQPDIPALVVEQSLNGLDIKRGAFTADNISRYLLPGTDASDPQVRQTEAMNLNDEQLAGAKATIDQLQNLMTATAVNDFQTLHGKPLTQKEIADVEASKTPLAAEYAQTAITAGDMNCTIKRVTSTGLPGYSSFVNAAYYSVTLEDEAVQRTLAFHNEDGQFRSSTAATTPVSSINMLVASYDCLGGSVRQAEKLLYGDFSNEGELDQLLENIRPLVRIPDFYRQQDWDEDLFIQVLRQHSLDRKQAREMQDMLGTSEPDYQMIAEFADILRNIREAGNEES